MSREDRSTGVVFPWATIYNVHAFGEEEGWKRDMGGGRGKKNCDHSTQPRADSAHVHVHAFGEEEGWKRDKGGEDKKEEETKERSHSTQGMVI